MKLMNRNISIDLQLPEGLTRWERFKKFTHQVVTVAKNKVVNFFKGFYQNIESVGVLTLSAFGLSALLGELPFWVTLPWWIEGAMVIPVLSVMIILLLITIGEKRAKRRMAHG
jgi:hypothetical protein